MTLAWLCWTAASCEKAKVPKSEIHDDPSQRTGFDDYMRCGNFLSGEASFIEEWFQVPGYEETNYIVGVVNDLCGIRNHTINKTLYRRKTNLTVYEGLESLSALERVFNV